MRLARLLAGARGNVPCSTMAERLNMTREAAASWERTKSRGGEPRDPVLPDRSNLDAIADVYGLDRADVWAAWLEDSRERADRDSEPTPEAA